MSKARDEYYKWSTSLSTNPIDSIKKARIYISELEQFLADAEARCTMWIDAGVLLSKEMRQLKAEKAELVNIIKEIKQCAESFSCVSIKHIADRVLNKYSGVKS